MGLSFRLVLGLNAVTLAARGDPGLIWLLFEVIGVLSGGYLGVSGHQFGGFGLPILGSGGLLCHSIDIGLFLGRSGPIWEALDLQNH